MTKKQCAEFLLSHRLASARFRSPKGAVIQLAITQDRTGNSAVSEMVVEDGGFDYIVQYYIDKATGTVVSERDDWALDNRKAI